MAFKLLPALMPLAFLLLNACTPGTIRSVFQATLKTSRPEIVLTQGVAMTATSLLADGNLPCALSPAPPSGLQLNSATCTLSGTPTVLDGGQTYVLSADTRAGTLRASIRIAVVEAPPASPTGFTATGALQSVTLSWTPVLGATGYVIYRKNTSGVAITDSVACTLSSGAASTCTDSGLADGQTYYYAMVAKNTGGPSSLGSEVSTVTTPAAPAGVTVTPSSGQNLISWTAVAGATSYVVKSGPSGGPYTMTISCTSSTPTSCTKSGLTNGTTYRYVVYAVNASGTSSASAEVSGRPIGGATKLGFIASPGGASYASSATFSPSLTVAIQDSTGATVLTATDAVTIALVTNTASGTLSGTLTRNAVNGIATFDDIKLDKAASNYTMKATSGSLTDAPTTAAFTITAGAANQVSFASVASSAGLCNGPFTLRLKDAAGNNATNTSGSSRSIALTKSAGSAAFYLGSDTACTGSPQTSISISNGSGSANFYLLDAVGETFDIVADGTSAGYGSATVSQTVTAIAPSGSFAFAANNSSATISLYNRDVSTGLLTANSQGTIACGSGPNWVQVDPTRKFVYSVDANAGKVSMYVINQLNGQLSALSPSQISTGSQPQLIAFHPTGKFAYVPNYFSDTISEYTVTPTTGQLSLITSLNAFNTGPRGMAVHPNGLFAYSANNYNSTIGKFSIDLTTGALTSLGTTSLSNQPYRVVISPNGNYLYTTLPGSNAVLQYSINTGTGALTYVGSVAATSASGISFDPAGRFAFVTTGSGLQSFTVDATTGVMTSVGAVGGAGGYEVDVDPSGYYAYVTKSNNTIQMYLIDQSTGALTALTPATIATGTNPFSISISK